MHYMSQWKPNPLSNMVTDLYQTHELVTYLEKLSKPGPFLQPLLFLDCSFSNFYPAFELSQWWPPGKVIRVPTVFFSREYVPEIIQIGSQDQRNRYLDHKPYTEYYQLYILYLGIASLFHLRFMISWSC